MSEVESESRPMRVSEGQLVMPFYLILDLSGSMSDDLQTLHTVTKELITQLRRDPATDDTALLSVIAFGSNAEVIVPLSKLSDIGDLPRFSNMGGTSYVSAWEAYDRSIRADYQNLKAHKARMHRPCVFFMTDGFPNSTDRATDGSGLPLFRRRFLEIQGAENLRYWPYVLSYGFRQANEEVLAQLAYPNFGDKRGQWFLFQDRDVPTVLNEIETLLFQTIVQTTATGSSNHPQSRVATPSESSKVRYGQVDETFP